jgi:hypothetical protein
MLDTNGMRRRKLHRPFNLPKENKHATAATQKILVKYRNGFLSS